MRETISALIGAGLLGAVVFLLASVDAPPSSAAPSSDPLPSAAPASVADMRALGEVQAVTSYTLSASLDVERHVISGSGTIRFVNASKQPLDHLFVHLYLNAFEHENTVFRRERSLGFRGHDTIAEPGDIHVTGFRWREQAAELWSESAHSPGDPNDRTDIEVPLPRPLAPNETMTIETSFQSKLPSVALRTGFAGSFHMAGQWFPKIAKLEPDGTFAHFPFQRFSEFYSDFGDYDVTVDVPEAFVVGATGGLVDDRIAEGRHVLRFRQRAVHDFAFTAWDGFEERSAQAGSVALRCLFPKGQGRAAGIELDAAARGLAFYGEWFGAYPYETLTIVHPPEAADEAGGMEYPTLITTGGSYAESLAPGRLLEGLTLHELGHQWFYGLVASNENASPLLDEGLTSYATGEALVALYGVGGLIDIDPFPVSIAAAERARQVGYYSHLPVAASAGEFVSGADYGALVYGRAATIYRTLDLVFDGVFRNALADFARSHRFAHPTPQDLVAAVQKHGGVVPAAALSTAIFEKGWLDVQPLGLWSRAMSDGKGFQGEVVVARNGDLALPVVVEMTDTEGKRQRQTIAAGNGAAKIAYQGDAPVAYVVVDPDGALLIDENKRNDALSNQPAAFAWRTWLVASLSSAALFHATSP